MTQSKLTALTHQYEIVHEKLIATRHIAFSNDDKIDIRITLDITQGMTLADCHRESIKAAIAALSARLE